MADIDKWRSQKPEFDTWSVTLDGYRYVARPVSARKVAEWLPRYLKANGSAQLDLMRELFRIAFPWRMSYVWRGDPVERLMALPLPVFLEVRNDFFVLLGVRKASSAPATSTTSSQT